MSSYRAALARAVDRLFARVHRLAVAAQEALLERIDELEASER